MKRRYSYLLLFAVPTLLVSLIGAAVVAASAAGVLWLFVFGDSPWPAWTGAALGAAALAAGATLWAVQLSVAFLVGRQQEGRSAFNRSHGLLALAATVLLAGLLAVRLLRIGSGPATAMERCADFCSAQGYAGSGMPPRDSGDTTCTCYDAQGKAASTTQIEGR